ncbi:MAG TPA: hypothetical protein VH950_00295 [Gaiellaceae bacterium]|jgi:hypothetical protein
MGRTQAGRPAPRPDIAFTREFDFWLGEWDVRWPDGGAGTSSVYCDFDDRVIVESFDGRPSSTIQGMSLSTYDEEAGVWRQCWVDSRGRFTVVSGGFDGEAMDLRTDGEPLKRARWRDITADSFTWTLEESSDRGRTWEQRWELHYTRVL